MGLFSFLSKNKPDSARADSGLYSSDEPMERARSKRASNAGGAASDPVLPEKKRARRRLVGAIALALAVAVGLPMILDTEPKQLAADIEIQIPAKDKPVAPAAPSAVAASDALDPSEEIVSAPGKISPAPAAVAVAPIPAVAAPVEPVIAVTASTAPVRGEPAKGPMPLIVEAPREEAKIVAKVEPKLAPKVEPHHIVVKEKPEPAKSGDDAARAMAILEGKPSVKAAPEHSAKYALQIAALATQDKVDELQSRLKEAGINSYTQKTTTAGGDRIRVRLGPFASKEEAEKARGKLANIGLSGSLVPL